MIVLYEQVLIIDHADVIAKQVQICFCFALWNCFYYGQAIDTHCSIKLMLVFLLFTVIFMQNWSNLSTVIKKLNSKPSKNHGTDQMRIRPWYIYIYNSIFLAVAFLPNINFVSLAHF